MAKRRTSNKKAPSKKLKKNTGKKQKRLNITKHQHFLSLLASAKNARKRNILIDFASKKDLDAVYQCIFNVLAGNVPIDKKTHTKLKRHKNTLRLLVNKKGVSDARRKSTLKQKGGFLQFLLPLLSGILPAIAGAITGR